MGFVGVLISLVTGFANTKSIMKQILANSNTRELLYKYFKECIISGFLLIIISIALFFRIALSDMLSKNIIYDFINIMSLIKILWVYCLIFFTLSSYRVIYLVLKASFISQIQNNNSETMEDDAKIKNHEGFEKKYDIDR